MPVNSFKMETLCRGDYFIKCEMVLKICFKLSKFRINDGRKGSKSRPYNNQVPLQK